MNHRWTTIALLLMVAGLSIPQPASQYVTPEIRRVGDKLACKCGACNNTVATCQMLECHYTLPARERIAKMQKAGLADQEIVDTFVKEMGIAALAVPPAEGFHLLGWLMPFIGIALGLGAIALYIKRFRKPATVPATAAASPGPVIADKYKAQIEREMAELD